MATKAGVVRSGVNALIVLFAIGTVWRLSGWSEPAPSQGDLAPRMLQVHSVLNGLPGVSWDAAPRTVAILLRTTCPACEESASFYKVLAGQLKALTDVRFAILSTDPEDIARDWLGVKEIDPDEVIYVEDPAAWGFLLTPTLMIVDKNGIVTDSIIGKLSVEQEQQLLPRLRSPSTTRRLEDGRAFSEINESELDRHIQAAQTVLVDVREHDAFEREHRPGTVNPGYSP